LFLTMQMKPFLSSRGRIFSAMREKLSFFEPIITSIERFVTLIESCGEA